MQMSHLAIRTSKAAAARECVGATLPPEVKAQSRAVSHCSAQFTQSGIHGWSLMVLIDLLKGYTVLLTSLAALKALWSSSAGSAGCAMNSPQRKPSCRTCPPGTKTLVLSTVMEIVCSAGRTTNVSHSRVGGWVRPKGFEHRGWRW